MIWLKRLLPLLVIGLGVGGYFLWDGWNTKRLIRDESEVALVTAQVWVATAKYRNEPEKYMKYRDSLLQATGVPRERVIEFLKKREDEPENLLPFAERVQKLVDSLSRIEDSIARAETKRVQDSTKVAGQNPSKS